NRLSRAHLRASSRSIGDRFSCYRQLEGQSNLPFVWLQTGNYKVMTLPLHEEVRGLRVLRFLKLRDMAKPFDATFQFNKGSKRSDMSNSAPDQLTNRMF